MIKSSVIFITAIFGLAILAVIVGKNSPAPAMISSASVALSKLISSAVTLNAANGGQPSAQQALQHTAINSPTALLPGLLGS